MDAIIGSKTAPGRMQRGLFGTAALACLLVLADPGTTLAQSTQGTGVGGGGGQPAGGASSGGRHGGGRRQRAAPSAAPATAAPTLKPDPRQRLDPGALLCPTEVALQQHQAAVTARLSGANAAEASGCRIVQAMTPVNVLDRHGPARTHVRIPGKPDLVGWTDALIAGDVSLTK